MIPQRDLEGKAKTTKKTPRAVDLTYQRPWPPAMDVETLLPFVLCGRVESVDGRNSTIDGGRTNP